MPDLATRKVTRRRLLAGCALLLVPSIAGCTPAAPAATPVPTAGSPAPATQAPATGQAQATKIPEFKTGADVAKAEAEGALSYYGHDSDAGITALLDAFKAEFPRIKPTYVRAQQSTLYSKLIAERTAKAFQCDVLQISDMAAVLDFQKGGGFYAYLSEQAPAYKAEYFSKTVGTYAWAGVTLSGIAFNNTLVEATAAPVSWKDLYDPRWTDTVSVGLSSSVSQFVTWYMLREEVGGDFWKEFGRQKPKPFATTRQLYDRLAKGYDKICGTAEHPGYVAAREKGAAVSFVYPSEGVTVSPSVLGIASNPPHPEAAKLFVDWCLSPRGQAVLQNDRNLSYGSLRADASPLVTGRRLSDLNLLYPSNWEEFAAAKKAFVEEWNALVGI